MRIMLANDTQSDHNYINNVNDDNDNGIALVWALLGLALGLVTGIVHASHHAMPMAMSMTMA